MFVDQLIELLEGEDEATRKQILGAIIRGKVILSPQIPDNEQLKRYKNEPHRDVRTGGSEVDPGVPPESTDERIRAEGAGEGAQEEEKG